MTTRDNARRRRLLSGLLGAVTAALVAIGGAGAAPASASGSCPAQDRASNVKIMRPGTQQLTFPGSRSADFCDGRPVFSETQLWTGPKPAGSRRLERPGVGTWQVLGDGRLTFTIDPAFRHRKLGDRGPGHDATIKFAIVDSRGHFTPGTAVAFVAYPGASAFPDRLDTCTGGHVIRPLANDVPGWRGTSINDKRQAKLLPATLRLADTGQGNAVRTAQGTWSLIGNGQVRFVPTAGWSGTTPPLRYSVQDSDGNTASSTITVTMCSSAASGQGGRNATVDRRMARVSGTEVTTVAAEPGPDQRTWLPLGLAALCLVIGGLVLRRRRHHES